MARFHKVRFSLLLFVAQNLHLCYTVGLRLQLPVSLLGLHKYTQCRENVLSKHSKATTSVCEREREGGREGEGGGREGEGRGREGGREKGEKGEGGREREGGREGGRGREGEGEGKGAREGPDVR